MGVIQSTGGIIYRLDNNNTPRFLIIKRHAMSGKIERVAPKGKIQPGETPQQAAIREVGEEAGIAPQHLVIEQMIGTTSLRSSHEVRGGMDKDVTYFLMYFTGDPTNDVLIQPVEGYLGVFTRAPLEQLLGLVYYQNMREIFIQAHAAIQQQNVKRKFLATI